MVKHVQQLLNCWSNTNCNLMFRSVPFRSLSSIAVTHHIRPVCGVPLVLCLLESNIVCNKWSKNISSLIQQSPAHTCHNLQCHIVERYYTTGRARQSRSNRATLVYSTAVAIVVLGLSYAAVPLYRMFCQVSTV